MAKDSKWGFDDPKRPQSKELKVKKSTVPKHKSLKDFIKFKKDKLKKQAEN